ncbi:MAG: glycerophosphodiester phosphodiesterase family protein [Sharpea porci]|uniref:glycerophosphodiester phosphodiesterase family protein n=1 Tax=Sharpea porci TaxID=2652286 RepID=UPI002409A454|nr:glycerophosphodiester phosphodiesterase family protein [Sharpea porci]MDD6711327.1 glycerophosphodiester phosphodiesterase family protein [Sharpea porci]
MATGKHIYPHPKFPTKETVGLNLHEKKNLKATIYRGEGEIIEDTIIYKSDNPEIVSIDDQGIVTAHKEGYTEITAYGRGKTARLGLEVFSVPRGIKGFTAHRGVRKLAPENTMAAFKLAGDYGFDYIETDIQVTKDKKLVLFHDNTLKRMYGLAERHICDYTLDELKQLKLTGGNGLKEYPDEKIVTFEEYLAYMSTISSKPMIELKDPTLSTENKDQLIVIKNLIDQYGLASQARVTSAILDNIEAYEAINEESTLAYIVEDPAFDDLELLQKHHFLFSIKYEAANKDFLQKVMDSGLEVDIWIINDKKTAKALLEWPITSMTSDLVVFDH